MAEARRRVRAGEAGDVTWEEWAVENIHIKPSRLYELQHIGESENPQRALEQARDQTRERVRQFREKEARKQRTQEPERRGSITWTKDASLKEVRRVLKFIESPTLSVDEAEGAEETKLAA